MTCQFCGFDDCSYQRMMELKNYIIYHTWMEGVPPTQREMQKALGKSSNAITDLLNRMEETKHIRRLPNRWRAIEVIP